MDAKETIAELEAERRTALAKAAPEQGPDPISMPVPDRAERRRQQILDAAIDCFRNKGFHACGMAEIARASDMGVGLIYHYFENKNAIITAIVDRQLEQSLEVFDRLDAEVAASGHFLDSMEQCIADRLQQEDIPMLMEVFSEACRNCVVAEKLREAVAVIRKRLKRLVIRAMQDQARLSEHELDGRIDTMIAMFDGLAMRAIIDPDLKPAIIAKAFRVASRALLQMPPE